MDIDYDQTLQAIEAGLRDYLKKNNVKNVALGLSGGVDSSLTAAIAARVVGPEHVYGLLLPDSVTSTQSEKDALALAQHLGITTQRLPIEGFVNAFKALDFHDPPEEEAKALANLKARTRMLIVYYYANQNEAIVIGTSDKSEIALGYTTKHGDIGADILVIGDLYKTQVQEMARRLGLPRNIYEKPPSAELIAGLNAEQELGAPYAVIDRVLHYYLEEKLDKQAIIKKGLDAHTIQMVIDRLRINEHKRRFPPIIRVSATSFHYQEWRYPITNKFRE